MQQDLKLSKLQLSSIPNALGVLGAAHSDVSGWKIGQLGRNSL